jgi:putative peptidoglycan lipid II flippase
MEVLTRAFYARQDTRTPVIIGSLAMGLNVLLSFVLSGWFARIGWMPHGGLALANSLATAMEATALFLTMRRRLGGIHGDRIAAGLAVSGLASLAMAIGLLVWMQMASGFSRWLTALAGVGLGAGIYLLATWLLRVPELRLLLEAIRQRGASLTR